MINHTAQQHAAQRLHGSHRSSEIKRKMNKRNNSLYIVYSPDHFIDLAGKKKGGGACNDSFPHAGCPDPISTRQLDFLAQDYIDPDKEMIAGRLLGRMLSESAERVLWKAGESAKCFVLKLNQDIDHLKKRESARPTDQIGAFISTSVDLTLFHSCKLNLTAHEQKMKTA